jgi:hypothetical protein
MCCNPSLGLVTKAKGVARLWAKRKPGSHITYSRECKKVWGSEPSHSQGNSHFGRWSPGGLPKLQRAISGVKTQWLMAFFISLKKILKPKSLKWARISHLDIWNTSYGQKKGRESNCQFDSRPEKVGNRPNLLGFRQRATYHWKALDESYNFSLNCTSIQGLLAKLWGSKVASRESQLARFRDSHLRVPGEKSHLDVGPVERCRVYYKGEDGGFPQVQAVVSLVCLCC